IRPKSDLSIKSVSMKQRYPKLCLFLALLTLLLYLPGTSAAQCLCSNGAPALTEQHAISTTFSSNNTTILTIPKFAPSVGTLVCVNAKVYLTSTLRMKLENDETFPIDYLVKYVRTDTFSGPGIVPNVTGSKNKSYGPYSLGASDGFPFGGPDYAAIGPDTIYNKKLYETTTSAVTNYLGTGTVDFSYKSVVNTYAIGSDLYTLAVSSINKLDFLVTYSYCNTLILPLNLRNFQAVMQGKQDVYLTWTTQNENKSNDYEIEVSDNATQFKKIGTTPIKPSDGATAEYNFKYHPDQPVNGKLYFRIKQTNGKATNYSEVRIVNFGTDAFPGLRIYPNPAVQNINMQFDEPVSGEFEVELSNQVGQVVYTKSVRLNNSSALQLQLNNPPAPGIYYLRAKESGSKKVYSGKLLFKR
ncbi:MAG: choice-of-anchor E domain-containing protein, partial [Flavitalea sp.]